MTNPLKTLLLLLISTQVILGQPAHTTPNVTASDTIVYLNIPARPANAIGGAAFASQVWDWSIIDRETAVVSEILSGNVPSFSRKLKAVAIQQTISGINHELIFFAACDYMAIGSDQDYFYIPMTPSTAQFLGDAVNCTLPTKKMVDVIYNRAEFKLRPQPIAPSDTMTTVPVFWQHTDSIKQQFAQLGFDRSADNIVGGTKKDIIISNKIYSSDRNYERVVIYGWHLGVNNPIQPVYNGHIAMYADYSHGVRLISSIAFLDGDSIGVNDILTDAALWRLLSSEGVISEPYYPPSVFLTALNGRVDYAPVDFQLRQNYPNPFNPATAINYQLPVPAEVTLTIFDMLGRRVRTLINARQFAGNHEITWDGRSDAGGRAGSGVYIFTLTAGAVQKHRKMVLLR